MTALEYLKLKAEYMSDMDVTPAEVKKLNKLEIINPHEVLEVLEDYADSEGLERCPFCGGRAVVKSKPGAFGFFIGCANDDCVASIRVSVRSYDSRDVAINKWNTRKEKRND